MSLYMIIMFLKGYSAPFRVVTSEDEDGRAWGVGGRYFSPFTILFSFDFLCRA